MFQGHHSHAVPLNIRSKLKSMCHRLELEVALLSDARAVAGDITMVVTYDMSRLYMLEGLCLLWGGPVAAAVYVVR